MGKALIAILLFFANQAVAQQYDYNYDSLKRIINLHPNDSSSVRAYIDYASKFFYVNNKLGPYYLDRAAQIAYKNANNYQYINCLKNKGDYYTLSGDFKTATKIYRKALTIPCGQQAWLLKVKIKSNLATAYKNMGMLDSAQFLFEGVISAFNSHQKKHRDSIAMAFSFIQLFDVYKAQGLMEEAFYYGEKANALAKLLKFERGIGYGYYVHALKYQQGNQPSALRYCDSALNIAVAKKIPDLEQFAAALKAKILISQKKYREAELVMLPTKRFTSGSAQQVTYAKLAEIYYYLNNLPMALSCFKQSYKLAKNSSYRIELAGTLATGIAIYEKLNDYRTAFTLQKEYLKVEQEITSDKLKLNYQRAAVKFKSTEKDKQLAQKQLQIAQKDNQLDRQSFFAAIVLALILLGIILWVLQHQHQQKLQQQQELSAVRDKEFQALEATMRGEEMERKRLAKDLHDGIGGLISAIKITFSSLKNKHPELSNSTTFKNVIVMLDNASAEIRRTAHNLMPDMLARLGLDEVIQVFCEQINQRNQLKVTYQTLGNIERYEASFELIVYRIVLELLNNVIKHAKANQVLVQFTRHNELLTITIEDDGVGFDVHDNAKQGLGLSSLKERVSYLKGILDIDSSEAKGTTIYMEFDVSSVLKKYDIDMKIKIAIADDQELILQGLSLMLQDHPLVQVVCKNHGANHLLENLQKHLPDVLLLDIEMPVLNGIELCKDITKVMPSLKIIALTNFDEGYYVKQMLRNGARGYLLKNTDQETLLRAIDKVCKGEIFLDPQIEHLLLAELTKSRDFRQVEKLTRRETEILKLIAEERTNQEIAEQLFISLRTVETHRLNLSQKLGAKNTAALVKEAIKRSLI